MKPPKIENYLFFNGVGIWNCNIVQSERSNLKFSLSFGKNQGKNIARLLTLSVLETWEELE